MNSAKWIAGASAFVATLFSTPTMADEQPVIVDADQFNCLVEKIGKIPKEKNGVYVNIRKCRAGKIKIVRHLVPPPRRPDASGVESLIYLKPSQILCIVKNRKAVNRITEPAGPGRLKLKLDPCGK